MMEQDNNQPKTTLTIDFAAPQRIVHETFDLIELARSPVYALMLLKAEHTLFNGSVNRSRDFRRLVTAGILEDSEIFLEFLEKTLGEKNLEKQEALFKSFRESLISSYHETRYLGHLTDPAASEDLETYLKNHEDEQTKLDFYASLSSVIQKAQRGLKEKRVFAERHLLSVLSGANGVKK